jgi:putative DNA primase/helicase
VREGTSGNIKDGKYWPHSSNDPLKAAMYGNHAHTTFSTWCFYEHSGDEQAAARAAANELGIDLHGNQANGEGSEERPSYGLDDVGNGYRFADQHRKAARWTKAWGWMTYDGKRWRRDDRGAVWLMAKDTAKRIWDEARDVGKSSDDESTQKRANTLAKWAGLSQSREKLSAMLQMAQSELAASTDDFDTDPMLLNVQNGTIDLHTRTLRPHNPDDLITRVCKASYCPDVATPLWNDTLNRFQTSDNIAFLQRSLGLACSGLTDKAFWFFYGASGDNGKSTITATVATVLGDYSARISLEVLTSKRRGPGEEDQLASLAGARMVVGNEVAATALNATLIKDLSGEMDSIKTKFMGQSTFEFRPKFKLFLYGNKKPELDATDPALWNRVNCVPFERSIPKSEQIKNFSAKLAAEYDGILTWLVDGFAAYQHEGLNPPAAVTEATNDYRNEMDTLGQFIAACCVVNPKAQQLVSELREAYEKYSDSKASPKTFGRELKARGFVEGQDGKGRRTYRGIGLLQLPDRLVTEGTEDTEAKPSRAIRENTPNAETSLFPLYPLVPLVGNMEHRKTGKNAGNSESSGEEGTSGKSNHQTVSRQGDPAEKVPTNSKSSVDGKFDSSIIDYLAANGASKASVVAGHAFRQHGIAQHTQSDIDQIEGDIKRLIKSRTLAQLADKTLSLCEVQL